MALVKQEKGRGADLCIGSEPRDGWGFCAKTRMRSR